MPGQGAQLRLGSRKAAARRDFAGAGDQVAGAGVIAEARPFARECPRRSPRPAPRRSASARRIAGSAGSPRRPWSAAASPRSARPDRGRAAAAPGGARHGSARGRWSSIMCDQCDLRHWRARAGYGMVARRCRSPASPNPTTTRRAAAMRALGRRPRRRRRRDRPSSASASSRARWSAAGPRSSASATPRCPRRNRSASRPGKKAGGALTLLVEGAHAPLMQHLDADDHRAGQPLLRL